MRRFAVITLVLFLLIPGQAAFSQGASPQEKSNLAFAGDILLDGLVGDQIAKYGVNFPFAKVAHALNKADIAFANRETPGTVDG
ncbi:capsule biosynthesis protein, partial [Paenibacillus riograndensis]